MSVGLSALAADERLTGWAGKYVWAQMHTGDPGAAGTANVATTSTRKAITWDDPDDSVAGSVSMTHTNSISWVMAATEKPSDVSVWSAASGGDFGGSGLITADTQLVGGNFVLPPGTLISNQPVAA